MTENSELSSSLRICNFCNKTSKEVHKLVAVENYAICNQCISYFSKLLQKEIKDTIDNKNENKLWQLDPIKIKKYLDDYVISQDLAKVALSVGIVNHYKRLLFKTNSGIDIGKSNLLLLGPSGSGKSFLVKTIAKYLNVPFAQTDATSLTEAGYVGDDVETVISKLLQNANGDVELAQTGIIFIDEVDKIAKKSSEGIRRDSIGGGVQAALLKMVEGSIIRIPAVGDKKTMSSSIVEIDTHKILFIISGAFVGLKDLIKERKEKSGGIGFSNIINNKKDLIDEVLPMDFISFGMLPEFIGRFPIIVGLEELSVDDMVKIINETKNNLIDQFKFYFKVDGIDLEFEDSAIHEIAEISFKMKLGARSLRGVIEKILRPYLFNISTYISNNVNKIIITGDTVKMKLDPIFKYKN